MARISPDFLRRRFARVMGEAGFDVTGPAYSRTDGKPDLPLRATVGFTFLKRGAMGGWYIGQMTNRAGAERNLVGTWSTLDTAGIMAFLDGVEMMTLRAAREAQDKADVERRAERLARAAGWTPALEPGVYSRDATADERRANLDQPVIYAHSWDQACEIDWLSD